MSSKEIADSKTNDEIKQIRDQFSDLLTIVHSPDESGNTVAGSLKKSLDDMSKVITGIEELRIEVASLRDNFENLKTNIAGYVSDTIGQKLNELEDRILDNVDEMFRESADENEEVPEEEAPEAEAQNLEDDEISREQIE